MKRICNFLVMALCLVTLQAVADPLTFESAEMQERFEQLTEELRCLVCQNQSLADSDAPLAQDLRNEIHAMLERGDSDAEIKSFLVARYGDFVLYRPPVQGNTLLLWVAPFLLLGVGIVVMGVTLYRRRGLLDEEANDAGHEDDPGRPGSAGNS